MKRNTIKPRSPTSQKIITALADGPRNIGELCQLVDCSFLGTSSAIRALWNDGTVAKVRKLDRPDVYKLKGNEHAF